ncbi:MAG: DUF2569 family protein [Myxococcales bacterium]|nr:DUF2569 family protein [Myxococcales bacterium]
MRRGCQAALRPTRVGRRNRTCPRLGYDISQVLPLLETHSWGLLTTPGLPSYRSHLGTLLLVELCGNLTMLLMATWVAFLYWSKSRSFPVMFIANTALWIVALAADRVGTDALGLGGDDKGATSGSAAVAAGVLWSVYMLVSRRVRATFLPPPEPEGAEPEQAADVTEVFAEVPLPRLAAVAAVGEDRIVLVETRDTRPPWADAPPDDAQAEVADAEPPVADDGEAPGAAVRAARAPLASTPVSPAGARASARRVRMQRARDDEPEGSD